VTSVFLFIATPSPSIFFVFAPFLSFSPPTFLFLQQPPCPICCSLWVRLVGVFHSNSPPLDFVCDCRRSMSLICRPLLSLFTRPHRVKLPTPFLQWYLAYTSSAPFQLPYYPLWAPFLLFSCFVGSFVFFFFFVPFFLFLFVFRSYVASLLHTCSSPTVYY
jgi:hypothetical protein